MKNDIQNMEDNLKVDEAIAKHLKIWLTDKDKQMIISEYGETIFNTIISIFNFADRPELWQTKEYKEAHNMTINLLLVEYPFLSKKSARKVADMAAYSWK